MLVHPAPWQHIKNGGLITSGTDVVRGYDLRHAAWLEAAHTRGEFDSLYHALNILGSVPWCVWLVLETGRVVNKGVRVGLDVTMHRDISRQQLKFAQSFQRLKCS